MAHNRFSDLSDAEKLTYLGFNPHINEDYNNFIQTNLIEEEEDDLAQTEGRPSGVGGKRSKSNLNYDPVAMKPGSGIADGADGGKTWKGTLAVRPVKD